jgi:hypothetical protein
MIASLRCLLLIEEAFHLGATNDRARADLDRFDTALLDLLVEKCSGDAEIVSRFTDCEARLMVGHIAHGATSCWSPVSEAGASAVMRDYDVWMETAAINGDRQQASGDSGGW